MRSARLAITIVGTAGVITAAVFVLLAAPWNDDDPPPWLERRAESMAFGGMEPKEVRYELDADAYRIIVDFGRVVPCPVCSRPGRDAPSPRARFAEFAFDPRTRAPLGFTWSGGTAESSSAYSGAATRACLRRSGLEVTANVDPIARRAPRGAWHVQLENNSVNLGF